MENEKWKGELTECKELKKERNKKVMQNRAYQRQNSRKTPEPTAVCPGTEELQGPSTRRGQGHRDVSEHKGRRQEGITFQSGSSLLDEGERVTNGTGFLNSNTVSEKKSKWYCQHPENYFQPWIIYQAEHVRSRWRHFQMGNLPQILPPIKKKRTLGRGNRDSKK